jgi:prevent-host-death family protein
MSTVTVAQAKAHLSKLLDLVQAGEEVLITRRGRTVARVAAVQESKQPLKSRAAFRARMPKWRKPSAELLRMLRDQDL